MLHGKIIGIKKNHSDDTITYVSVLISREDAIKEIHAGNLHLFTESAHGIQKPVIVKHTGRADNSEYLTTSGDPSESNNVEEQPEI